MKKFGMISKVSMTLALLFCLGSLAGCSSSDHAEVTANRDIPENGLAYDEDSAERWADYAEYAEVEEEADYYDDVQREVAGASDGAISRKVIRNAFLTVEADSEQNITELYAQLSARCNEIGGYEFSCDIDNSERYSNINAVLKIPPEKLDEFTDFIGTQAKIIRSSVSSDDVTDEYYDLETRLDTKRRSLERYFALLENADTTEEIIQLQRTIDSITEDIEATEGRLRVLKELIGMATVTLSVFQENDPARHDVEWGALGAEDMGYYIKNGFIGLISIIWGCIQWIAIILIITCPLWIPATVIVVLLLRRQKAKKAKRAAEIAEAEKRHKENKENQENE